MLPPTMLCRDTRHLVCLRQSTDEKVEAALSEAGLRVESHAGYLLHEPADVRINMGGRWVGHFGTLTPFHRRGTLLSQPARCQHVHAITTVWLGQSLFTILYDWLVSRAESLQLDCHARAA